MAEHEVKNIVGRFLQPPKVGDVFVNANRHTAVVPRYEVVKVNAKSVRLVGIDRGLDFNVRLNSNATRSEFARLLTGEAPNAPTPAKRGTVE